MESKTKNQPLVILTHPLSSEDVLYNHLTQEGCKVMCHSMISTQPLLLTDSQRKEVLSSRKLIFTSKRGVEYFLSQFKPADVLDKSFICVGKKTALTLERSGLKPWWVSNGRSANDLVDEIREYTINSEEKWTALLGDLADDTIVRGLSDMCRVNRFNTYQTNIATEANQEIRAVLKSGVDVWVVLTSPSCFIGFNNLYGDLRHDGVHFASIGPVTTDILKQHGLQPSVTAALSTYEGLVYSLGNHFHQTYN